VGQPRPGASSPTASFLLAASLIVAAAAAGLRLWLRAPWILGVLAGINVATMALYGYDKAVAGGRRLRVPERVLHLLALLGGTPAAIVSRPLFRHKTGKAPFRLAFWMIVLLQAGLLLGWGWCREQRPAWIPAALDFLFAR
jgi:uncharacterized membrane protein YsdA (DUF1294 family)